MPALTPANVRSPAGAPALREVGSTDVYDQPLSVQEEVLVLRRRLTRLNRLSRKDVPSTGRARWAALSFVALVLMPILAAYAYLAQIAVPQYYAETGFTTRLADSQAAGDVFAGAFAFGGGTQVAENDILYAYLLSPALLADLEQEFDLVAHYAAQSGQDPVFLLSRDPSAEDMRRYWARVFDVTYDPSNGLIQLRLRARDPDFAQQVLDAVIAASTRTLNDINRAAFQDTVGFAEHTLADAEAEWRVARAAMQAFRVRHGIVDPSVEIESRMGVLTSLQHQLATVLIDYDELRQTTGAGDPRVRKLKDKVAVIRNRLAAERSGFSGGNPEAGQSFPALVSGYEALATDVEFAQLRYTEALASLTAARADAAKNSRYLAVFAPPSRAQEPEFPRPLATAAVIGTFCVLGWLIGFLIFLSLRGRR